jgi:hypothetical protein
MLIPFTSGRKIAKPARLHKGAGIFSAFFSAVEPVASE